MFHLATPVRRWAERSQQRACRNAMVASTALTRARVERDDVQDYVAGALARRAGSSVPAEVPEQRRVVGGA